MVLMVRSGLTKGRDAFGGSCYESQATVALFLILITIICTVTDH